MNKKNLVMIIVVLGLITVLYLVALGAGMSRNDSVEVTMEDLEATVAGRLDRLFRGSSPRVEVKRLSCNAQRASEGVVLTQAKPSCRLDIRGSNKHDYRKLEIGVEGGSTPVWLRSFEQGEGGYALDTPCVPYVNVTGSPRLEVAYRPAGEEEDSSATVCWIRQEEGKPVGLAVMRKGGVLVLDCKGCTANPRRELRLKLR
ncbi:MAG TPA: hypothetical protein ENN42_08870 [Thioalkalivibrio sp.]|nr:hypothetical protein [Thioalkalivibrio sp.]